MARILAVHGIGQQLKGESVLVNEWLPYLKSGLEMCNNSIGNDDLAFAFYGNLFRTPGFLSAQDGVSGDGLSSEEVEILMDWWAEAARTEPERVPSPQVYLGSDTLGRTPQMV
ncbi:MAG TPA: hypothetical protein PKZ32_21165, partial [Candidatus Melainabacteria bacterium]|nr:hypothetical protein [Candidatus Melainabacteria bacterium]